MTDNIKDLLSKFTLKHAAFIPYSNTESEQSGGVNSIIKHIYEPKREVSEGSVFSKDLIVKGSVSTLSNITIEGVLEGDLTSKGDVIIRGTVQGNINGVNVNLDRSQVRGNIESSATVILQGDSTVSGDIRAMKVDIAGVITGNITATENVIFRKTAIVTGDIEARIISISEGAVLNGKMKIMQQCVKIDNN